MKEHAKELIGVITQVLPFLVTTGLFIGLAYTYTHPFAYCQSDNIASLMRLSCNCLP